MSTTSPTDAADRAKSEEANRNLASIRPSFIVKDLQASITYYHDRLGFQLDFQGPDGGPFWAGVSRDGIGIMLKAVAP
ncbi:MAG TPA: VOC family protein, partial [Vicinamibacterales bacterium]|nr:VOC family protein [Vicinamibacterales bacterium]